MKNKSPLLLLFSYVFVVCFIGSSLIPLVHSSTVNSPCVIEIFSIAKGDPYSRFHALTFDNEIPTTFWRGDWYDQNEDAIIGAPYYAFHYETTVFLAMGEHTLEYAISSFVGYWRTIVIVNGALIGSGNVTVDNHLIATFVVDSEPSISEQTHDSPNPSFASELTELEQVPKPEAQSTNLEPPKLELMPNSGISSTTVVGSGFTPNSQIIVTWNNTELPTIPNPLISDEWGNFTTIVSVLNQTDLGLYMLKASDETGNHAENTFEVIPEFNSFIIILIMSVFTAISVIFFKKDLITRKEDCN